MWVGEGERRVEVLNFELGMKVEMWVESKMEEERGNSLHLRSRL